MYADSKYNVGWKERSKSKCANAIWLTCFIHGE